MEELANAFVNMAKGLDPYGFADNVCPRKLDERGNGFDKRADGGVTMAWEMYRCNRTLGEVKAKGCVAYEVYEDIKAHENVDWWYEDWNGIDTVEAWQYHMGYAFDRLKLSDEEYAQLMLFVCNIGESMDSMFSEGFTYELAKFFDGVYKHQNGEE